MAYLQIHIIQKLEYSTSSTWGIEARLPSIKTRLLLSQTKYSRFRWNFEFRIQLMA